MIASNNTFKSHVAAEVPIKTELEVDYLPNRDVTILWQNLYVGDDIVQTCIVGFYHGCPDDRATAAFNMQPLIAQYM